MADLIERSDNPQSGLSRRGFLKIGAASAVVGAGALSIAAAPKPPANSRAAAAGGAGSDASPGNTVRAGRDSLALKIDISGAPTASANVESITMEDLVIDEREMTTGADWDYRVSGPGDAHYGSITIRARVGKNSKELYQWWLDCSQGKNIRKNISVIALNRDGSEARRFNLLECFPTRWDPGEYSPSSNVACETIVCKMGRVELA